MSNSPVNSGVIALPRCSAWTIPSYQASHPCERSYNVERVRPKIFLCPHHRIEYRKKGDSILKKRKYS